MDEWEGDYNQYATEGEDDEIIYDTEAEKNAWIYGVPGEEGYVEREAIDGEDILILEEMWHLDHDV